MTKTASEVRGVLSSHERPEVKIMKDPTFENKNLSRDQYEAKYAKLKKAEEAADAARRKVLGEADATGGEVLTAEEDNEAKIKTLRSELASVEKKLKDDPTNKKLLKEKNKIAEELDRAEE